jgi:hypothetical protein
MSSQQRKQSTEQTDNLQNERKSLPGIHGRGLITQKYYQ